MKVFLWQVREIKEDDGERKCPRVCWDRLKFKVVKGPLFSSTITKYFIFDSHPNSERRPNRVYVMLLCTTYDRCLRSERCLQSETYESLLMSYVLQEETNTWKTVIPCCGPPCSCAVLMTHDRCMPTLWHPRSQGELSSDFVIAYLLPRVLLAISNASSMYNIYITQFSQFMGCNLQARFVT
jgi:hypothetical protein